jgi:AcrR family transcriptional regulator
MTATVPLGEQRRREIIEAAIECYDENGTKRTTIADVARRVGVTPGNILYHFGSKQDLVVAVVQELETRRTQHLESMAAQGGLAMLRALAASAHETEARPNLAKLALILAVENLGPDDQVHQYFLGQGQRDREIFRRGLRVGVRRGELRSDVDLDSQANEIRAFMAGCWVVWLLDPERESLAALYDGYFSRLVQELATVEARPKRKGP